MQKHYSLIHAEKVLKAIRKAMPKTISKEVSVDLWSNGREQGFHLENHKNQTELVFAQQRNSDEVLVVCGTSGEFNIITNHPSEEVWAKGRRCFRYDSEAVFHIIKHMTGAKS